MKNDVHFLSYLVQSFLEGKTFETKVVEKATTPFSCSVIFFPKIVPFMR